MGVRGKGEPQGTQLLAVPPSPENLLSPNSLHDGGKDLLQIFV